MEKHLDSEESEHSAGCLARSTPSHDNEAPVVTNHLLLLVRTLNSEAGNLRHRPYELLDALKVHNFPDNFLVELGGSLLFFVSLDLPHTSRFYPPV